MRAMQVSGQSEGERKEGWGEGGNSMSNCQRDDAGKGHSFVAKINNSSHTHRHRHALIFMQFKVKHKTLLLPPPLPLPPSNVTYAQCAYTDTTNAIKHVMGGALCVCVGGEGRGKLRIPQVKCCAMAARFFIFFIFSFFSFFTLFSILTKNVERA